jgi:hypothetical protein
VDHREGCGRQRLDDEVTVAHGVDGVAGDTLEPEVRGDGLAVEREPGTREGARAER